MGKTKHYFVKENVGAGSTDIVLESLWCSLNPSTHLCSTVQGAFKRFVMQELTTLRETVSSLIDEITALKNFLQKVHLQHPQPTQRG